MGEYNRTALNDSWRKVVRIAGYRIHENFDESQYQNDIAVINTAEEVQQRL